MQDVSKYEKEIQYPIRIRRDSEASLKKITTAAQMEKRNRKMGWSV